MTTLREAQAQLQTFGQHYDYDTTYLQDLAEASPAAFEVFGPAQALSTFREHLPLDAHFVARVVTMQNEDCGPCAQLNLRMAIEAGVERSLLEALIDAPDQLPEILRDLRAHVQAVVSGAAGDPDRAERLRTHYGAAAFAELAVVIAGSRMYPTLKRALLDHQACSAQPFSF